ncbi:MAG: hypothetical protein HYV27_10470 [Candidatus Hydrogenedentes bacterium]|nr:hypothetical protein [Candidatus Hydrogenedentota bacterium]
MQVLTKSAATQPIRAGIHVIYYGSAALLPVLVLVIWCFWPAGTLRVPIVFEQDALFSSVYARAFMDQGWASIPRLGAPFSHNLFLFPQNAHLDYGMAGLIAYAFQDFGIGMNLGWLIKTGLAALLATWSFRQLKLTRATAWCAGVLYGLLPYGLFRNVLHFNLSHWLVPVLAVAALLMLQDSFGHLPRWKRGLLIGACVLAGFNDPYAAFFACFLFAVVAVLLLAQTRVRQALAPLLCILLMVGCGILNTIPAILALKDAPLARQAHGERTAVEQADQHALYLRNLLLPVEEHPVDFIRNGMYTLHKEYKPQFDTRTSHLGAFGAVGFLILLGAALFRLALPKDAPVPPFLARLLPACALCLACVLLGTAGGFGSLLMLGFDLIRCYNRVSVYIAFFSFFATAAALDLLVLRLQGKGRAGGIALSAALPICIVLAGIADQVGAAPNAAYLRNTSSKSFHDVKSLVGAMESRLDTGAMIYTLPNRDFAYQTDIHSYYRLLMPYLLSGDLRFSYAPLVAHDKVRTWQAGLHENPPEQFIQALVIAGFDGILIDRQAYRDTDHAEYQAFVKVLKELGPEMALLSESGDFAFYDLSGERRRLMAELGADTYKRLQRESLDSPHPRDMPASVVVD